MGGQGGRDGRLHVNVRRDGLAVTRALRVRATTVDLEVRIRMLAAQDTGALRHAGVDARGRAMLVLGEVRLSFWGGQVRLALLQMLDLARGVLRAHEAAVQTSHLVALGRLVTGRIVEMGACCDGKARGRRAHLGRRVLILELSEGAPDVGICVAAHFREGAELGRAHLGAGRR